MRQVLKWGSIILGSILFIVLLAGAGFGMRGRSRLARVYTVPGLLQAVPSDSATVAIGQHMVAAHGCRGCHGQNLEGRLFIDIPLFRIVAPNLTRGKGGIGGTYTDQDWDRSIRHGVRPSGKSMLVMPYPLFHGLADGDAAALIAYLKTIPAVDSTIDGTQVKGFGFIMLGMAKDSEVGPNLAPSPYDAPPVGPTAEYGKYVASHSCVECHGPKLSGGKPPDPNSPPAPNLVGLGMWSLPDFTKALRTGVIPDGRTLTDFMPWKDAFTNLNDTEITALHEYIKSLASSK